jgi:mannose-6-phosphate isomerase
VNASHKLIRFAPIYHERVWGGQALAEHFSRPLPEATRRYGESWELVDRPEVQSMVVDGPLRGLTLHELWQQHRREIFGEKALLHPSARFPLLLKILTADEDLSLQVHPPAELAASLGGEPKTEMWVIAQAKPGAVVMAGVQPGVSPESLRTAITQGTVTQWVPRLPVSAGDYIFIPSGRLHAIGAGLIIFEIQQNSDTTYRVFDWNRLDPSTGRPRQLHVEESLACIDFHDTNPHLGAANSDVLVDCPYFYVRRYRAEAEQKLIQVLSDGGLILIVIRGRVIHLDTTLKRGDHALLPAQSPERTVLLTAESEMLIVSLSSE